MGNFGSSRFGGRSRGRDRDNRDRFSGRDSRRAPDMHDVTCDKCGIRCQVPFRPTGDKPVLCSDCFRKNDSSRNSGSQSGASFEQLNQINKKLDKILLVLQDLELEIDEDGGEEIDEDYDDSDDEESEEELDDDSKGEEEYSEVEEELEK